MISSDQRWSGNSHNISLSVQLLNIGGKYHVVRRNTFTLWSMVIQTVFSHQVYTKCF